MRTPVLLPPVVVEHGTEMLVSFWFADLGDEVLEGDRLVEILAGPVTFDVPAPMSGWLVEIRAVESDAVRSGDLLAVLETNED